MRQTCAFQIPHQLREESLHVVVANTIKHSHAPEAQRAGLNELLAEDVPLALAISNPLVYKMSKTSENAEVDGTSLTTWSFR